MMRLIEGAHYRRKENQPLPAPHKSKEAVSCLLYSDPGDDDRNEHVTRKRARPIGQNLRLDRLHAQLKSHHPDACREGARSLLTMGFSRRAPSVASIATEAGDDHERMASGSLPHVPSPTGIDFHIGASTSLRAAPSTAGHDSFFEAS
jgi:hypothetical protein